MVLERKQLDMGAWAQHEMSLIGSNIPHRAFYLFPLNLSLCTAFVCSQGYDLRQLIIGTLHLKEIVKGVIRQTPMYDCSTGQILQHFEATCII